MEPLHYKDMDRRPSRGLSSRLNLKCSREWHTAWGQHMLGVSVTCSSLGEDINIHGQALLQWHCCRTGTQSFAKQSFCRLPINLHVMSKYLCYRPPATMCHKSPTVLLSMMACHSNVTMLSSQQCSCQWPKLWVTIKNNWYRLTVFTWGIV